MTFDRSRSRSRSMTYGECRNKDCEKDATHYPEITVAPYNYPISRGMTMQFGLPLCFYHARTVKAADLFDEEAKRKLREATKIVTKSEVPLDFTRTRIVPRRLGDDKWQLLHREREQ